MLNEQEKTEEQKKYGFGGSEKAGFVFTQFGEVLITIDMQGFIYRGKKIEDAGEIYNLMVEFLKNAKQHKIN